MHYKTYWKKRKKQPRDQENLGPYRGTGLCNSCVFFSLPVSYQRLKEHYFKGQLEKQKYAVPSVEVVRTDKMPSVPMPGGCSVQHEARGTTAKVPA